MKQYYKIWVYDNCGTAVVENKDYSIAVSEKENVIVLTIEELKEIWEKGYEAGKDDLLTDQGTPRFGVMVPDFETYLESKGISL